MTRRQNRPATRAIASRAASSVSNSYPTPLKDTVERFHPCLFVCRLVSTMRRHLPLATLLAVLLALVTTDANQQKVSIGPGFFTGKDYLEMTDNERRAYATGAINGMLVAPFFGAPDDNLNWLKQCTAKLSDDDIAGILGRYIRDQESQLNYNLNILTFNAIRNACPKTK